MALITRTPMVDDDGSGETGTVVNNDWKQELYNQIDALAASPSLDLWTVIDSTATGVVTDWAPGLSGHTVIFWNGAADLTINSIAGGSAGQQITIRNNSGSGWLIHLPHYVGATTNSLVNMASSAPTSLAGGGSATYMYQAANGWRLIAHEQGAWITPPYSAANFFTMEGGATTWTVEAADISYLAYRLSGKTLTIGFYIVTTSVSGGTVTQLAMKIPGGFTYAGGAYLFNHGFIIQGGVTKASDLYLHPTYPTQVILRYIDSAPLSLTANDTSLRFTNVTIPIA